LPANGARAGLLGHAGLLALNAHATLSSPTLRGRFVRQVLMCQEIPPPPNNVSTMLPEPIPGGTMRDRLERHRTDPACNGCHVRMDPIGLGLENFDGIGAYRANEGTARIDPSGDIDGMAYADARSLGTLLRGHPAVGPCLVRKLYRYATGHIELASEAQVMDALSQRFASSQYRLRALLVDVAASDGFRLAVDPQ